MLAVYMCCVEVGDKGEVHNERKGSNTREEGGREGAGGERKREEREDGWVRRAEGRLFLSRMTQCTRA